MQTHNDQKDYSYFLAEVMNAGVWEWNVKTGIVKINPRWAEIIGYTYEEITPVSITFWEHIVHPDDLAISNHELDVVFAKQKPFYAAEVRMRHKDGHWVWVFDSGKVVEWSETGEPLLAIGTHIDITMQKEREQVAQDNAMILQEILDNTIDVVYRTDNQGKLTFLSQSVTMTLGYDREQALGVFLQDFIHPEDQEKLMRYFNDIINDRKTRPLECFRLRHADGSWRSYETLATPLIHQNQFVGYVGVARDITQIQQMNQELKTQRDEMERFFKVNLDLLCITDSSGNFYTLNNAWEVALGYPIDYMLNRPIISFVHPDDVKETYDLMDKIIRTRTEVGGFTNRYRRIDGSYCYLEWKAMPFGDRIYASARDITKRIVAQKQLLNEKEHFQTTLMSVGDGIIVTDNRGFITELNRVASKLTSYKAEEAVGRNLFDIYKVDDHKTLGKELVNQVIKARKTVELTSLTLETKEGSHLIVDQSASPIIDHSGVVTGVVIAFRDVSEAIARQLQIEYLSYRDQLTDLYNRHYLDKVEKELQKEANLPLTLISLDLNNLKYINDNYGHLAGDDALRKVAEVLSKYCCPQGLAFRIGGDEFIVLVAKTSLEEGEKIKAKIVKEINRRSVNGYPLYAATGISVLTDPDKTIYDALKIADHLMYEDKFNNKQIKIEGHSD